MKNQVDHFDKIIKILKDLKKNYPDVEISKHFSLATDCSLYLTDKELFNCFQNYESELEMNTLSNKDMEKLIENSEDIFKDLEEEDGWEDPDY